MPTFDTPEPIRLSINVAHGDVRVTTSDDGHTHVQVLPRRPTRSSDVRAAEQTEVTFAAGAVSINAANGWPRYFFGGGAVEVIVAVPSGSALHGEATMGGFEVEGELGEVRLSSSMGSVRLERVERLWARTSYGSVQVAAVERDADVGTNTGEIRLGQVGGRTEIRNSNGDTTVDLAGSELRVKSANGNIDINYAKASVAAKTANGNIRLRHVESGSIEAKTSAGTVEVGIVPGTRAWLDVATNFGRVHNSMATADGPAGGRIAEIRAHTSYGDVTVRPAPIEDR